MTNTNKSLASESDGDVFVGKCHTFVGSLMGGSGESSIGSKTKLFEKVFPEFKTFLKIPCFQFFKSIVPVRK